MSNVAVIAVHGVGDQKPYETARAVMRLLQADSPPNTVVADGFVEEALNIPVERLSLSDENPDQIDTNQFSPRASLVAAATAPAKPTGLKAIFDRFDERTPYERRIQKEPSTASTEQVGFLRRTPDEDRTAEIEDGIGFMFDQVCKYDPRDPDQPDRENSTYDTLRFRGSRLEAGDQTTKHGIDVYELYWADLSQLGKGLYDTFTTFYQLIFHVCSLGRNTLDLIEPDFRGADRLQWRLARYSHAIASFILTMLAPVLHFCLLSILMIVLPAKIPESWQLGVSLSVTAILVAACFVISGAASGGKSRSRGVMWMIRGGSIVAGTAFIAALWVNGWTGPHYRLLACQWGVLATAGFAYVMYCYFAVKPQSIVVGAACWIAASTAVIWRLFAEPNTLIGLARVAMQSGVTVLLLLLASWAIMGIALFVAGWATFPEWIQLGRSGNGTRKQRALGTAFISLILPVTLFAAVTISLYTPLFYFATDRQVAKDEKQTDSTWVRMLQLPDAAFAMPCLMPLLHELGLKRDPQLKDLAAWMIEFSTTRMYPIMLAIWIFSCVLAIHGFFWSALFESTRPNRTDREQSRFVGQALTTGFRRLGCVFVLLFLAFPVAFSIAHAVDWYLHFIGLSGDFYKIYGIIVSTQGAALGAVVLSGKLDDVVRFVWPPLHIILDIDNYLRNQPVKQTPKARIATRYVALLRYLATQNYDKVVIVAHSQGTVITADLLRFLRQFPDPKLQPLGFDRVYAANVAHEFSQLFLVTFGCPLRQLYGWRFPNLYKWARYDSDATTPSELADGDDRVPATIDENSKPNPRELGVARWINAYCSGDYVGRNLWRKDSLGDSTVNSATLFQPWDLTPTTESRDRNDEAYTRRELCFGVGAHTHYFEDNSKELAILINDLLT